MPGDAPYRDELAAAHARIRELEDKLAEAQRPAGELAAEWLASLEAERQRLIEDTKRKVPLRSRIIAFTMLAVLLGTALFGVSTGLLYVAVMSAIPFLVIAPLTFLILARQPQIRMDAIRPKLAALDARIDDARRTASLVAKSKAESAERVRVAIEEEDEDQRDVEDQRAATKRSR